MKYRTFVAYHVIGGLVWSVGVTTLGFYLGEVTWVRNNVEVSLIAVVALSLLPVALELLKHRRVARREHAETR